MTLSPSLRGGSSYTGAILPPRPPRLGAAGFTDPVGPGFIIRVIRSGPNPSRRQESRSSPAELTLFCAVPTTPRPFPSSSILLIQTPAPKFRSRVCGPCPFPYPSASVLGPGAPSLCLNVGLGSISEALNPASYPGVGFRARGKFVINCRVIPLSKPAL